MFLHSGLAIKSSTDSLKDPEISAEPSVWHVCPDVGVGGVGEGKQRSRVEQLEPEMRRSCGGMCARGAVTRSS